MIGVKNKIIFGLLDKAITEEKRCIPITVRGLVSRGVTEEINNQVWRNVYFLVEGEIV